MLLYSNLELPLCLYVGNKLWYGIENISGSHSASNQLSGEFMLLHSIHTLANLALKETVPPQSRTSPHVTVKIDIQYSKFRASASCSKILDVKSILNTVKNFRANSVFQGKRRVAQKSWMVRNIFNTVKILRENSVFEGKCKLLKILSSENILNTVYSVYIHWTGDDPCNLG